MPFLVANAGASSAVGPMSGGKLYAFNNIGTTPQVVAQANPQRAVITFHNPGPANLFVAPVVAQGLNAAPATPSDVPLTPSPTALGGCFLIYANGGQLSLSGENQKAYQAFALSGTTNPLTVAESNIP